MTQTDHEGSDPPKAAHTALPEGFVIDGKYEVKRMLGRGGSGSVYEAQHAMIGHRVAIKVVHSSEMRREVSLARFKREAKICGAIRHPHVGQIYDVGALEDGTPFMVMELHEGRSLGDILDESVLPIAAIVEVARQLLAGLAAVHDAGAIHRDVKPDNAMIVRASSGDLVVKLVDFGISKVVRADIRERALTRKDIIIGSPDYMAPEQLRGHEVDVRTDLYAVGVLLYEAVTGRVPFDAENMADLMIAIMCDPVTPPSQLRTDCPLELEHLILKAMSRDPADRFQSAGEMSRQLAHVQRTVHYAADPGLARLREPMPPRHPTTRRARGIATGNGPAAVGGDRPADVQAEPAAAAAQVAVESGPPPRRARSLPLLVFAVCATLAIGFMLSPPHLGGRALDDSGERAAAPSPATPAVTLENRAPTGGPAAGARSAGEERVDIGGAAAVERQLQPASSASADGARPAVPAATGGTRRPTARSTRAPTRAGRADQVDADGQESGEPSIRALLDDAASAFVLGQMPRARSLFQRVLERQPTQAEAWRGLGLTASRMGDRKDAERAFERYLKLRPNAPDAARIREQLDKVR